MNALLTKIATEAKVEHCISHVRLQDFADLIVKECNIFLKDKLDDHFAAEQLLEHFEVD